MTEEITPEEVDEALQLMAEQIISAIEKDIGEPLIYTALTINDVEWDEETGTISIDYDYEGGTDD